MTQQNKPETRNREMANAVKLICELEENLLLDIVMRLTGGSANPNVVRGQIQRIRGENPYKHSEDWESQVDAILRASYKKWDDAMAKAHKQTKTLVLAGMPKDKSSDPEG